ncbi:hypothetical protein EZJ43_11315 [Pedobacter changchengzhani]|uniref:Bacterial virulence domain-containing protein n=1 Tax=Pedobacter changchengzhani TaxID=2529274 RepID=A0A4R5MJW6_9SPHI|nr:AcvB/VirJ family lysyl-phosphatidylglycerol hydrolase [Pedobacter changchengzhani]TDG35934.1 hypothetical protein EZJ43_11315 [Pedobacter changchengzhani]
MKKIGWLLLVCITTLNSCALLKRNRVAEHNGIEKDDYDLPIFLYPVKKKPSVKRSKKLVIFLAGDGGWIKFEDDLATKFTKKGFITIGFNSRSYFWKKKTPDETSEDISSIIKKYSLKYRITKVYLCGYSFGADVLPFVYNRLSPLVKKKVVALEMLSPYCTTDFMVHFADLINKSNDRYQYNVDSEITKIKIPIYCFYGKEEEQKPLATFQQANFFLGLLDGDHHYDESGFDKIINVFHVLKN